MLLKCPTKHWQEFLYAAIMLDVVEEGLAWNVRIEKTVPDNYNGYRDGILASRMEIMNVFDGNEKLFTRTQEDLKRPTGCPMEKVLLFNQGGFIYTYSIEGGTPQLNTGTAKRNNNDHVISFDGKMLAITSHRDGMPGGGSTVYYLPLTGGEPKW